MHDQLHTRVGKAIPKSQPLADKLRAIFHCKQTVGQKMSQLITEKENERFAANTADMTQDDLQHI